MHVRPKRILPGRNLCEPGGPAYGATSERGRIPGGKGGWRRWLDWKRHGRSGEGGPGVSRRTDWKRFHNPKDLAISITLEAAELLEHFQWKAPAEVEAFLAVEENRRRLGEEMADLLILLVSLADAVGLDLLGAARAKLRDNAAKYPVERAKGSARKYNELLP
jgi:NTP pyrophosphatase (non-canonical NTP hydrolase)